MLEHLGASEATVRRLLVGWAKHSDEAAGYWDSRGARLLADGLRRKAHRFRELERRLRWGPHREVWRKRKTSFL